MCVNERERCRMDRGEVALLDTSEEEDKVCVMWMCDWHTPHSTSCEAKEKKSSGGKTEPHCISSEWGEEGAGLSCSSHTHTNWTREEHKTRLGEEREKEEAQTKERGSVCVVDTASFDRRGFLLRITLHVERKQDCV